MSQASDVEDAPPPESPWSAVPVLAKGWIPHRRAGRAGGAAAQDRSAEDRSAGSLQEPPSPFALFNVPLPWQKKDGQHDGAAATPEIAPVERPGTQSDGIEEVRAGW